MSCSVDAWHWTWWGVWYPWAEANPGLLSIIQSLLSVVALIVAYRFFLHEQKRANEAESNAQRLHREAAAERGREYERAAIARAKALLDERIEHLWSYQLVVGGLARKALQEIKNDHKALVDLGDAARSYNYTYEMSAQPIARNVADSLIALQPSSPKDPAVVLYAQEIIAAVRLIADYKGSKTTAASFSTLEAAMEALTEALRRFLERVGRIDAELRQKGNLLELSEES